MPWSNSQLEKNPRQSRESIPDILISIRQFTQATEFVKIFQLKRRALKKVFFFNVHGIKAKTLRKMRTSSGSFCWEEMEVWTFYCNLILRGERSSNEGTKKIIQDWSKRDNLLWTVTTTFIYLIWYKLICAKRKFPWFSIVYLVLIFYYLSLSKQISFST